MLKRVVFLLIIDTKNMFSMLYMVKKAKEGKVKPNDGMPATLYVLCV